jgi:hypothetical protein
VVLLFGARWYLDRQWYVAPSNGHVAIFQGIPLSFLGYELGHPAKEFDGSAGTTRLPAAEVTELGLYLTFEEGTAFDSYEEAAAQVELMREELEAARRQEQREQREQEQQGGGDQ